MSGCRKLLEGIKENVVIITAFSYVLLFFAPLDFYYSNKDDLWYDVYNILGGVTKFTILTVVVLLFLVVLISIIPRLGKKISEIARFILLFLLVAFYIQGNYIRIPYGHLNGTPIVWNDYWLENITSVITWIGIFLLLLIAKLKIDVSKYRKLEKYLTIGIVLVVTFTLCVEFIVGDGKTKKYDLKSTTKNEWTYSSNKNFNILLMDCMDSRVFTDLIRKDSEFEKLAENFDGFTFYRDTVGCYNLTDYSVPVILTGQLYLGQSTYGEFIDTAYESSPLFNKLKENEWSANLYTTVTLPQGETGKKFDNLSKIRMIPQYYDKFIHDVYMTVCFRYMPTVLKKFFYNFFFEVGANRCADSLDASNQLGAFEWGNVLWNNGYQEQGIDAVNQCMFHYYHLEGIHAPRQYHSDFSFTQNRDEVDLEEGTVLCVSIINRWIEYLKKEDLYDNSVIVVLGDHGSWEYDAEGNFAQSPLLLIKGYDERHELMVSDSPISYIDLQEGFLRLLDGYQGTEVFENCINDDVSTYNIEQLKVYDRSMENVGRYRLFYFTYLMNEMGTGSVGGPFYEGLVERPTYYNDIMYTGRVFGE